MQNEESVTAQPVAAATPMPIQPPPQLNTPPQQSTLVTPAAIPQAVPGAAVTSVIAPAPATTPAQNLEAAVKKVWDDKIMLEKFLDLSFRLGLGMVFIINSVTAFVDPGGFEKLINSNFMARALGHTQLMLYIITANDLILGLLILLGIKKKYTYAWAGVWLFIVTFIKFTSIV